GPPRPPPGPPRPPPGPPRPPPGPPRPPPGPPAGLAGRDGIMPGFGRGGMLPGLGLLPLVEPPLAAGRSAPDCEPPRSPPCWPPERDGPDRWPGEPAPTPNGLLPTRGPFGPGFGPGFGPCGFGGTT